MSVYLPHMNLNVLENVTMTTGIYTVILQGYVFGLVMMKKTEYYCKVMFIH